MLQRPPEVLSSAWQGLGATPRGDSICAAWSSLRKSGRYHKVLQKKAILSTFCAGIALHRVVAYNRRQFRQTLGALTGLPNEPPLWEKGYSDKPRHNSDKCGNHVQLSVPVREKQQCVVLKRFMEVRAGTTILPKMRPAVLLVHGAPDVLSSRYLEPLASLLCRPTGRSCYAYDQLKPGSSSSNCSCSNPSSMDGSSDGSSIIEQSINDLRDVLKFMCNELGETQVHIIGHGFGGVLLAEAAFRQRIFGSTECESSQACADLPKVLSICLMSTPSSSSVAEAEAKRLMTTIETTTPRKLAPDIFWYRHNCAVKPQPACLTESYQEEMHASPGSRKFGAMHEWEWGAPESNIDGWQLQSGSALHNWCISRSEVASYYSDTNFAPPLMVTRGEHDFITEQCVKAWQEARNGKADGFREREFSGCGHNAHLEAPNAVAVALRMWFLEAEDMIGRPRSETASTKQGSLPDTSAEVVVAAVPLDVAPSVKVLSKHDAQQLLASWASEYSWADVLDADCGKPKQRERLSTRSVAEGLPHKAAFAVSRTLRNLSLWAKNLAAARVTDGTDGVRELHLALQRCARGQGIYSRLAVSMAAEQIQLPQLIVCLEALRVNGRCGLRIVGSVAALRVSPETRKALDRYLRDLIGKAGLPIH